MNTIRKKNKLPKLLEIYRNSDFIIQQRARFMYYLVIASLVTTVFVLIKTAISPAAGFISGNPNIPMLLIIFAGVLLYLLSFFLLIKGHYNLSVNITLSVALLVVWFALMHSEERNISLIDGVAYIFAVLSMVPLVINKGKYLSFLYSFLCAGALTWFVIANQDVIGIHGSKMIDYLIDTSLAFFLISFVGYHIHSINNLAFDKVLTELNERKQAEVALGKSERKYKEISDLLPQVVAEIKLNGVVTYLNKAGYDKFGISEEDFFNGINLFSLLLDEELLKTNVEKVLKGIHTGNLYTARRMNGETFPVQIYSSAIIENGEPIGFRSIIIDISENIIAEKALTASERKYKEMLLLLPQTVYESDITGRITFINKAGTDMFGHTEEDVNAGLNVLDTIAPDDHLAAKTNIMKLLNGETTQGHQYLGKRKDGSYFPLQIYSRPIIENNKATGFRGVIFDLTQIKKVENEIRHSNELFKSLIELNPIPTTLSDMNGRFLIANKAFCNDLGIKAEDAIGKTIAELGVKTDGDKDLIIMNLLKEKGSVENFEISTVDKDGKRQDIYMFATMVTINNQKAMLWSNVNVTEKKKLENQLKEYNQQLERTVNERTEDLQAANQELQKRNKELSTQREELEITLKRLKEIQGQLIQTEKMASLGILTAGVAHEVNNPLNYLMGAYHGLETYFQNHGSTDENKTSILLSSMKTGIERISEIVKGLNQFSRNNDSNEETCDIHAILDNCLAMLHNKLNNKVEIIKNYNDSSIFVKGNVGRLHQAFINIISNALQAIPDTGNIIIKSEIAGRKANIEIIDDGVGIDKKHMARIYDPFFTTKAPGEGTGLGLSIAQAIVKEHSGVLLLESEVNKGTKVILSFPLK